MGNKILERFLKKKHGKIPTKKKSPRIPETGSKSPPGTWVSLITNADTGPECRTAELNEIIK